MSGRVESFDENKAAGPLAAWGGLIAVAWLWGNMINDARPAATDMLVQAPPLTGHFVLRISAGILAPIAVAGIIIAVGPALARRVSWRTLVWLVIAASVVWIVSLVLGDATKSLSGPVRNANDYLAGVPFVGDHPMVFLRTFTTGIWKLPSHVRSHPPGVVLFLALMSHNWFGSPGGAAAIFVLGGAAAAPAVLVTVRDVVGEAEARAVAPFVVLTPLALWMGTSADALFAGIGAWAVATLVLASSPAANASRPHSRRVLLALIGGVLFAISLFLSYGVALLVCIPVVVAWKREALSALATTAAFAAIPLLLALAAAAAAGFWWLDGVRATHEQYLLGVARNRPYSYFLIANLAALAVAVGPAVAVGFTRLRGWGWRLVGGAAMAVAIADISGMSKGEVERIWLPFAVWLTVACLPLATGRRARGWLGAQAALAVVVQVGVHTPW